MDKDFFDNRLLYYGLDDFYKKRLLIKSVLLLKTTDEQYLYKMYVYSRAFINDTWKDYIWEYIQNDITDDIFRELYLDYCNKKRH